MRSLAIGDIHGELNKLIKCLDKCNFDPTNDKLYFVGDYVDRGNDNMGAILYLYNLYQTNKHTPVFINGNHDQWFKEYLNGDMIYFKSWYRQGGASTLSEYQMLDDEDRIKVKYFMNCLLLDYYVDDSKLFIHAGYTNKKGVGYEINNDIYWWDRDFIENAVKAKSHKQPQPTLYDVYDEIYIGHTPTQYTHKSNKPQFVYNIIMLDTGAGKWDGEYGKVTIMDIDTHKYWQS